MRSLAALSHWPLKSYWTLATYCQNRLPFKICNDLSRYTHTARESLIVLVLFNKVIHHCCVGPLWGRCFLVEGEWQTFHCTKTNQRVLYLIARVLCWKPAFAFYKNTNRVNWEPVKYQLFIRFFFKTCSLYECYFLFCLEVTEVTPFMMVAKEKTPWYNVSCTVLMLTLITNIF